MLLDVGRNDVGKGVQTGSVTVTDRYIIERWSHFTGVFSNVIVRLSADFDAITAISASFLARIVNGMRKVRAVKVFDE